ncbi:MAG: STAS domain-containing protein [Anaerolineales bacterium]|jgi:anti-sigma B factor antagonist
MMANLSIVTDSTQNVAVMKVKGRVDSNTASELDNALENLLNSNKDKIVLDLENVDYLSSAGLRALVKALKDAQKSGGDLRLAAVSEPIDVILRTVGMLQMFKMFPNNEEAVASF